MPRPKGEVTEEKMMEDAVQAVIAAKMKSGLAFDTTVLHGANRVEFYRSGKRVLVHNILGVVPSKPSKPRKKSK